MLQILLYTALAVVSTAVVWKGSGWLESSSGKLAAHMVLSRAEAWILLGL